MRLDKYLKVSRIIKRRTIAKEAADADLVLINGKVANPSSSIKVDDILTVSLGSRTREIKITSLDPKEEMFIVLKNEKRF